MPAAVIGTLLVPFGLDGIVWRIMGEGVNGVLMVAQWVASIENASITAPNLQGPSFAILVLALIVFVGLRTSLRWLALAPLALWIALLQAPVLPDLVIDPSARMALVRGEDGSYRVLSIGTPARFTLAQWLPALGDNRATSDPSLKDGVRCDRSGCVTRARDGRHVALVARTDALREDCRHAGIVITPLAGIAACSATKTLAREHFDRFGATRIVTRSSTEWRMETTLDPTTDRPWRRKNAVARRVTPQAESAGEPDDRQSRERPISRARKRAPLIHVAETLEDDPALVPRPQ